MSETTTAELKTVEPQCQHFVVRKKRLCRMTVRPGRSYCGEHEPKPVTADGEDDTRIACPYDSKHTVYSSKLERHLAVCNARPAPSPEYIQKNINAPSGGVCCERKPLSQVSTDDILRVVDKVHRLYEEHVSPWLTSYRTRPIHPVVVPEFTERGRTEASLRHLRQASSLLHIVEEERLVQGDTCYVELGAGKGQLSLFAWRAWCEDELPAGCGSSVLLVDRAALRHKRDARMRAETPATSHCTERWSRVRADLADVSLRHVPACRHRRLVGLAKHLCGAATDLALRSLVQSSAAGAVMATCCHHRCELDTYTGTTYLMELGLSPEEQSVMLGLVSWATCGDGRARDRAPARSTLSGEGAEHGTLEDKDSLPCEQLISRETFKNDGSGEEVDKRIRDTETETNNPVHISTHSGGKAEHKTVEGKYILPSCDQSKTDTCEQLGHRDEHESIEDKNHSLPCDQKTDTCEQLGNRDGHGKLSPLSSTVVEDKGDNLPNDKTSETCEQLGNRDGRGTVEDKNNSSPCDKKSDTCEQLGNRETFKDDENFQEVDNFIEDTGTDFTKSAHIRTHSSAGAEHGKVEDNDSGLPCDQTSETCEQLRNREPVYNDGNSKHQYEIVDKRNKVRKSIEEKTEKLESYQDENTVDSEKTGNNGENKERTGKVRCEEAGRRAKALLDWGRVLYLRGHGFDARLCHFVPTAVSLENVCIVAHK